MGGDVLYFESLDKKQEKYQCLFQFEDGSGFTCKFWWFGHIVLVSESELINDKTFSKIAYLSHTECRVVDFVIR